MYVYDYIIECKSNLTIKFDNPLFNNATMNSQAILHVFLDAS